MGPKMRTSFTRRKRQRARAHDTRKIARVCNEAKAAKRAAEARDREERSKGVQASLDSAGRSTGVGAGVGEKGASGWRRWIAACNNTDASGRSDELVPFRVGGRLGGWVRPDFARSLRGYEAFEVTDEGVRVCESLRTAHERTEEVGRTLASMRDEGLIVGWRDELYPVVESFDEEPYLLMERACAPYFGLKAYGVHMCAYVVGEDGTKRMWVARRSETKQTSPGKLDHLVAGGQPFDLTPLENVIKECEEEAGIPKHLAERARPAGAVSYEYLVTESDVHWGGATGLKRDCLFVYDLQLPESFVPENKDGEVQEFMLWPVERVAETVLNTEDFKLNCNLVIIDFLVRHGYITPENCDGYLELVSGLRSGDLR